MRILPLLLAATLFACIRTTTDPVTGRVDVDVESPTKRGEQWGARLGSETNPSLTGQVTARVISGVTQATIAVTGAQPGARLPWHIHEGTCGSGGPIVGSPSAYQPLVVGDDGRATGSVHLELQLNEARRYHVNLHASPSQMSTIIACGGLAD